jgi:hypothetical protein
MNKHWLLLAALLAVAACDDSSPNPVNAPGTGGGIGGGGDGDGGDGDGDGDGGDGGPIEGGGAPLPGTEEPTTESGIFRREARNEGGNGFAEQIAYDAETDTFAVDNLGFDGDNVFTRDDQVPNLRQFRVYESAEFFPDGATGRPISQLPHKAIYGTTPSGNLEFAIVRTGGYVDYGFGGFVYQRNAGVVLPTSGQASYVGNYAGLRDFQGRGGLEYSVGRMTMDIDFEDFNDGDAVKGEIFNRSIFDLEGNDVTSDVLDALAQANNRPFSALPTLRFVIGPGVLTENGEINGQLESFFQDATGVLQPFESGNYYAVIGGDNAQEVVGVIVVEGDDPRFDGVTVRETGGFALTR